MNRRHFVLGSALGLAGVLHARAASAFQNESSGAGHFDVFVHSVNAYPYPELLADDSLKQQIAEYNAPLLKSGYTSCSSKLYFCDQDRTVFVPYLLKNGDQELDRVVLFFTKDHSGKWQFAKTYSGFHLELFAGLSKDLKQSITPEELSDLLLPAEKKPGTYPSDVFYTRSAQIKFQVRLQESQTLIDYQILENQKVAEVTGAASSRLRSAVWS